MVDHPSVGIEWLRQHLPSHPYSLAGTEAVEQVLDSFKLLCEVAEYPFFGSLDQNWLLPSSLGAARPTCLVPKSMTAGDLRLRDPMLLVGFDQFLDFYPALAAENIRQLDVPAEELTLDLPSLRNLRFVSPSVLARLFENDEFLEELIAVLKPHLGSARRIGFPAVLGLEHSGKVHKQLEEELGRQVFEIPGLPPSIPGIRLHNLLVSAARKSGTEYLMGCRLRLEKAMTVC
jgi:glycerol-3-phosphate dehydrogenase subunit B